MNLPNYFLADLPREASLTESIIREACQTVRRNRERYLAGRTSQELIALLSGLAADWLRPSYPFRKRALEEGPAATGFSRPVLSNGLDTFFSQLTPANLQALLVQELGHGDRLDRFAPAVSGDRPPALALARAPGLLVHITAGNIPNPTLSSIVLGLLVRSAQFVKCATGTSFLPRLLAHSLYELDSKLASCLEIAEWPGGQPDLEKALFDEADCLTATGRDESLEAIQKRVPRRLRFLGYGHRVSFAFVARESISNLSAPQVIANAADDIVAWDQLGCLSPHAIYVEPGGSMSPEQFAERLAQELDRREVTDPRGPISVEAAAMIKLKRDFYQIRADHSAETMLWCSPDSTAWTVVFENDPLFQVSCLHRFVYVKPGRSLAEVLHAAEQVRGQVSTVGLSAPAGLADSLCLALAQWGAPRICPIGHMQKPPLTWRHDGRPALGDWIAWTDCEPPI